MTSNSYKAFFGFRFEPFSNTIKTKNLMELPSMLAVKNRLDYCLDSGGCMVVTGEVGAGKSTSLRWAVSQYHPSDVQTISVIASSGSFLEVYRQLAIELDISGRISGRSKLVQLVKSTITEVVRSQKRRILLIFDEANLLRIDTLQELHTLLIFEQDSMNNLTLVLCGQSQLRDNLAQRSVMPLCSRVMAHTHLGNLSGQQMEDYLNHHVKVAGVSTSLFEKSAVNAVYQGSGGILRTANSLARGGLVAASLEKKNLVSAEHIRIAASEVLIGK
jgi:type II secretory pathway predicted ATPase ExeA